MSDTFHLLFTSSKCDNHYDRRRKKVTVGSTKDKMLRLKQKHQYTIYGFSKNLNEPRV